MNGVSVSNDCGLTQFRLWQSLHNFREVNPRDGVKIHPYLHTPLVFTTVMCTGTPFASLLEAVGTSMSAVRMYFTWPCLAQGHIAWLKAQVLFGT